MKKEEIFSYISDKFGVEAQRVFDKYPEFAVFRHTKNLKWFALLMNVEAKKLGFDASGEIEILNVKCNPDLAMLLRDDERILQAYHMNKKHWISVNLSSGIDKKQVFDLIDTSFELTGDKRVKKSQKSK
ncbi:MmcQ/YjbR family DNA-binding protein [Campylobacter curvus]|uniref:DNA-binding protein, MmcQ/YjbR family n=1 Tax=Campylobacter curvus (strain 525.92) TaxID=360105 RepID=A0A0M3V1R7_CAMC5|nr:MmcQ/YjbR family DNA-binding protein [Campylobacter curvus]ALF45101.1 putative DNA-binding protein, MmcQ/YjbR family [Campylobacter curvus 525.92]